MPRLTFKLLLPILGATFLSACVSTNIQNPITTNAPPHTEIDATLLQPPVRHLSTIYLQAPAAQSNVSPNFIDSGFKDAFSDALLACDARAEFGDTRKAPKPDAVLTLKPVNYTTLQFDKNPPSKNNTQLVSVSYEAELRDPARDLQIWTAEVKLYPSLRFAILYDQKPDEVLASDIVNQLRGNGVLRGCLAAN